MAQPMNSVAPASSLLLRGRSSPQGDAVSWTCLQRLVAVGCPWTTSGPGVASEPAQHIEVLGNGGLCGRSGEDENDPGSRLNRLCAAGGLSGATVIDSLDTLYLMELKEEFQEAKAWVEENFHLNVVSQSPSGC